MRINLEFFRLAWRRAWHPAMPGRKREMGHTDLGNAMEAHAIFRIAGLLITKVAVSHAIAPRGACLL